MTEIVPMSGQWCAEGDETKVGEDFMTDNDVIKWWREIIELCNECHPDSFKNVLSKDIANATLDLINRQKAEIEYWKERYERTMDNLKAVLEERGDTE